YPPLVHAIDEHGDGLIQPGAVFAGLCTTQGWQRLHPGENCEVHARNVRSDIFRIHDSGFCDVGVRKSSYGCRHVLERLLSFLSRYDYFLELSLRSRKIRTDDQKCHRYATADGNTTCFHSANPPGAGSRIPARPRTPLDLTFGQPNVARHVVGETTAPRG